jgi:hypothetical protein
MQNYQRSYMNEAFINTEGNVEGIGHTPSADANSLRTSAAACT